MEACLLSRDIPPFILNYHHVTLEQNLISFKRPLHVACDPISFAEKEGENRMY